jgi:hypothetical protein
MIAVMVDKNINAREYWQSTRHQYQDQEVADPISCAERHGNAWTRNYSMLLG